MRRHLLIGMTLWVALAAGCGGAGPTSTGADFDSGSMSRDATGADLVSDLGAQADRSARSDAPADATPGDGVSACDSGEVVCASECVDLQTNVRHCGGCDTDCTSLAGVDAESVQCTAGRCAVSSACLSGRADCNGTAADGCEADLATAATCGSCAARCDEPTPVCAMGETPDGGASTRRCASGCTSDTSTRCGGTCVDLQSDLRHCGACGHACPVVPFFGTSACVAGECRITCAPGNHVCGNRCEPNDAPASCGDRCEPCPTVANGVNTCDGTNCGFICNVGFHRCGDRCLSNTSLASCGTSCTSCVSPTNGMATCDGERCGGRCFEGAHLCGDTCVSNLAVATCGASCAPCTAPENATATCNGERCDFQCNAGFHRCGERCVADDSPMGCGASCVTCSAPANATPVCVGGACGYRCNAGTTPCGLSCVDLQSNLSNCGACGRSCYLPSGTAVCREGRCEVAVCESGRGDCNGEFADGCETQLTTNANCGACGQRCDARSTCEAGVCRPVPTCGPENFTVSCPSGGTCVAHSLCAGSSSCTCETGYIPVTCDGQPCRGACNTTQWWCVVAFCGGANTQVPCPDGRSYCATNSTCSPDSLRCTCNPGYEPVNCSGVSCTIGPCPPSGWWCVPRR